MSLLMARKTDPDAMTGESFAQARAAFGLSQKDMAERLGIGLRTVIRHESKAYRLTHIPLPHAKLVRCMARELGKKLKK